MDARARISKAKLHEKATILWVIVVSFGMLGLVLMIDFKLSKNIYILQYLKEV